MRGDGKKVGKSFGYCIVWVYLCTRVLRNRWQDAEFPVMLRVDDKLTTKSQKKWQT